MGLREKSDANKVVGEWAFSNKHYDAAVSRYYYSLLQVMIHKWGELDLKKRDQIEGIVKGRATDLETKTIKIEQSHKYYADRLQAYFEYFSQKNLGLFKRTFKTAKEHRIKADYDSEMLSENEAKTVEIAVASALKIVKELT